MVEKEYNPIYDKNTIEFVTLALEYCAFVEGANQLTLFQFADKAVKILPLLYLKATLLPKLEVEEDSEPETSIDEEMYENIRTKLANLLGDKDAYLETFHADMRYSDTPIAAFISENLADVYQDTGNFVALFRQGNNEVMQQAIAICQENFTSYWGQQLLNALKALHVVRYDTETEWENEQL